MQRGASFDATGRYRYELTRRWGDGPELVWIMLNPSVADAAVDDPTIRRCIGFSAAWSFDAVRVVNLFALRATDPRRLRTDPDPEADSNLDSVLGALERTEWAIAGWGTQPGGLLERSRTYRHLIAGTTPTRLRCLGVTLTGEPRHPLYMPAVTEPVEWSLQS